MPDQKLPENFSDWNEEMILRHDPERFHDHARRVVRWIEGGRVKTVLKLLRSSDEHRVLDVGCGAGNVLAKAPARERHGIDLSPSLVKRAQEKLGSGGVIVQGNAEQLPYDDEYFDRVLCTSVLSHVYAPEKVLAEAYRVLKPGGRLVVSVSNEDAIERGMKLGRSLGLGNLLFGKSELPRENVYNSEYHLHHFDLAYLRESAKGLPRETRIRKIPWIWPVHLIALYTK